MFGDYDDPRTWVLRTGSFSGTYAIGLSFVFLAYFLHPAVGKAYQRVRAYRGWRAIEANKTVEVTSYPLVSEMCGGRGRWDAARIVAIVLASFSLASWGLELQMDLAHIDGFVTDLFLRPPPVWKSETGDVWYVIQSAELNIVEGEVPNMDKNFSVGTANARYEVNSEPKPINGRVRIASWDTDVENAKNKLFYNDNGEGIGNVATDECTSNEIPVDLYVEGEDEPWGKVVDCKNGPQRVNGENNSTSHAVKLTSKEGKVYFIVEESSTYPSFLYSVWNASNDIDGTTTLHYVYHISSSVRLAEAVVTEIIHADKESREPTGGRSFALLRVFSEKYLSYDVDPEDRASPFGEHPTGEKPEDTPLSTIESVEKGIELNTTALICAVWLMVLALVGMAWSLLLRFSIEIDIYDRDELIRAVTLADSADGVEHSSKMRIFVRKVGNKNLSVVISDVEAHPRYCGRRCRKKQKIAATDDPIPETVSCDPNESYGNLVPNRPQTLWLEGVRIGKGRAYPGRKGNYRYPTSIALVASPVPSRAGSIAGTPVHRLNSPAGVSPSIRHFPSANSALFDSVKPFGDCEENYGDIEIGTTGENGEPEAKPGNSTNSPSPQRCEFRETELQNLRELLFLSERTATPHDRSLIYPSAGFTRGSSFEALERFESSPADPGEEVKDSPNVYSDAEVAETE